MTYLFGVDSVNRADVPVDRRTGCPYRGRTPLLEFAAQLYGGPPAFWGRYLNDREIALDRAEVDFIRSTSGGATRLLLIYNRLSSGNVLHLRGDAARTAGRRAAEDAEHWADLAGAGPQASSVRIFLDLERWPVAPELILGWFERMHDSPYLGLGGLYGRVFPAFQGADANVAARRTRRIDWWSAAGQYPWSRALSRTLGRFGDERPVAEVVADILGDRLSTPREYSCTLMDPRYIVRGSLERRPDRPTRFEPGMHGTVRTTIWQYGRDVDLSACPGAHERAHPLHLFDLDMATLRGHHEMWDLA